MLDDRGGGKIVKMFKIRYMFIFFKGLFFCLNFKGFFDMVWCLLCNLFFNKI